MYRRSILLVSDACFNDKGLSEVIHLGTEMSLRPRSLKLVISKSGKFMRIAILSDSGNVSVSTNLQNAAWQAEKIRPLTQPQSPAETAVQTC